MSVLVTLEFPIKPEKRDEFVAIMGQVLPDTRTYDGCEQVDVYVDQDDPGGVILVEQWESREKQEAYFAWRAEEGLAEALGPFLAGEFTLRYWDHKPGV